MLNAFKKYQNNYSGKDKLFNKPLHIGTSAEPDQIDGPQGFMSPREHYLIRISRAKENISRKVIIQ